jgi:hypothetical protein
LAARKQAPLKGLVLEYPFFAASLTDKHLEWCMTSTEKSGNQVVSLQIKQRPETFASGRCGYQR